MLCILTSSLSDIALLTQLHYLAWHSAVLIQLLSRHGTSYCSGRSEHTHHIKLAVHGRGGHKGGDGSPKQRHHCVDDAVELLEGSRRKCARRACMCADLVRSHEKHSNDSAGDGGPGKLYSPSCMSCRVLYPVFTPTLQLRQRYQPCTGRSLSSMAKPSCSSALSSWVSIDGGT